jgi:hypothetical protein
MSDLPPKAAAAVIGRRSSYTADNGRERDTPSWLLRAIRVISNSSKAARLFAISDEPPYGT